MRVCLTWPTNYKSKAVAMLGIVVGEDISTMKLIMLNSTYSYPQIVENSNWTSEPRSIERVPVGRFSFCYQNGRTEGGA